MTEDEMLLPTLKTTAQALLQAAYVLDNADFETDAQAEDAYQNLMQCVKDYGSAKRVARASRINRLVRKEL